MSILIITIISTVINHQTLSIQCVHQHEAKTILFKCILKRVLCKNYLQNLIFKIINELLTIDILIYFLISSYLINENLLTYLLYIHVQ